MKQHKWHKEIKAWADGAEIECRTDEEDEWDISKEPLWLNNREYRIKPHPKELHPKEPQYVYVFRNAYGIMQVSDNNLEDNGLLFKYLGKIKLEPEYE